MARRRPIGRSLLLLLTAVAGLLAGCGSDEGLDFVPRNGSRATGSPVPHVKAPRLGSGWLHTDGTRLVDDRGREVRFTGLGLQTLQGLGLEGHPYDVPSERDFDNIAAFGFNEVRLPIRWLFIEPNPPTKNTDGTVTHHWDQRYLRAIDAVIRGLGKRDIKVVLSMNAIPATGTVLHDVEHVFTMPTWLYPDQPPFSIGRARCEFVENRTQPGVPLRSIQDGLADVWRLVARRYVADPTVVGADILNEPYLSRAGCPNGPRDLGRTLTKLGSAILEGNRHLVLVFEDGATPGLGQYFLPSPPDLPNVLYSLHVYAHGLDEGMRELRAHLDRARRWNVPLYMGEFNGFGAATRAPEPNWERDTREFLGAMKRDDVSWSFWAYCCAGNSLFDGHGAELKPKLIPVLQSGFD